MEKELLGLKHNLICLFVYLVDNFKCGRQNITNIYANKIWDIYKAYI